MSSSELRIDRIHCRELHVPFRTSFRHASAERAQTETLWVEAIASDGAVGYGESCPRPYVTGESLSTARAFIEGHAADVARHVRSLDTLKAWSASHVAEIDANPAAWCGIELAVLDLLAKAQQVPIEGLLSLPPLFGAFRYTAVVGDAPAAQFHAMVERYWERGFRDFKIKLSGNVGHDRENVEVFRTDRDASISVRADANNLWRSADEAIAALRQIDYPFFAIEEPIAQPAYQALPAIAAACGCPIVVDESLTRLEHLALFSDPASRWIVNIRVSKMGGVIRSLSVLEAARSRGIRAIVGAQVGETSLLTRAGLVVAHAAGDVLVAQEGAFGTHLLERDICEPPLMFGAGGLLDVSRHPMLMAPGLGIPYPIA